MIACHGSLTKSFTSFFQGLQDEPRILRRRNHADLGGNVRHRRQPDVDQGLTEAAPEELLLHVAPRPRRLGRQLLGYGHPCNWTPKIMPMVRNDLIYVAYLDIKDPMTNLVHPAERRCSIT